jgi:hypothetical protein
MMKIEKGKKYIKRDKGVVTILTTTRNNTRYPIVAIDDATGDIATYTLEGCVFLHGNTSESDLTGEFKPYSHIKEGDMVLVRNEDYGNWIVAKFIATDSHGIATVFEPISVHNKKFNYCRKIRFEDE